MFSGAMTDPAQQPAPQHDTPTDTQHDTLHDFDVQKELHRQIRNDPDYDDWEYGTEPLPHEAWVAQQRQDSKNAPNSEPPAAA